MQTSAARMAKRRLHPRERRARCPPRASGDVARATPTPQSRPAGLPAAGRLGQDRLELLDKVADVLELAVDARKPHEGHLIEPP